VVGADGLHSNTRRLMFGPESRFVRHAGVYVATVALGEPLDTADEVLLHNTPGRAVSLHPSTGSALAAFMFRSPPIPGFDHRDMTQHKRLLETAFDSPAWMIPQLIRRVRAADDLYFDSVSRVRLPTWSNGRVTLLGDAASGVSLFGDGSSLAMAGAMTLARSLHATADLGAALARYEVAHRKLTAPKQRAVRATAALLIPRTRAGLATRNLSARVGTWATRQAA